MESRTDTSTNKKNAQQSTQKEKMNKNAGDIKSEENRNLDQGSQVRPNQQKEMKPSDHYEEGAADSVGQDMRRSRDDAEDFQNQTEH